MEVRPIRPGEEQAAWALARGARRGEPPGGEESSAFRRQAQSGGAAEHARQLVAVTPDGEIVGCAMYFPSLDGSATVSLPVCAPAHDTRFLRTELMRTLRAHAARNGVLILQAFCGDDETETAAMLAECGFDTSAVVLLMARKVSKSDRKTRVDRQIRWKTYTDERHELFSRTVGETYKGTLDFPNVAEVRDIDRTLEAYRVDAKHDPSLWLLAEIRNEAVGCVLISCRPEERYYNVDYFGVVPRHRGRGLGRKLMEKGLLEVALRSGKTTLTVAVDEENVAAVNIYCGLGFEAVAGRRTCFSLLATA